MEGPIFVHSSFLLPVRQFCCEYVQYGCSSYSNRKEELPESFFLNAQFYWSCMQEQATVQTLKCGRQQAVKLHSAFNFHL